MNANRGILRNTAILAAALALWTALVLLFAAPLALHSTVSWQETVRFGASFWALWLFFLPAVAWLSFRFPLERDKLLRNFGLHLLACALMVVVNRAAFSAISGLAPSPPSPAANDRPPGPPRASSIRVQPGGFGIFLGLRSALDVLVYWAVAGACHAVTNFRRSQERERRAAELQEQLTRAQLQALRMQINPHFLFNTLNSIAALIHVNPRAADEMLGDLSELLRRSLESTQDEIPLTQELDLINAYLRIEQKRFGDRLTLHLNIPDDLKSALVPALILQPLVENSIRHGIEPQRDPGSIWIEAHRDNQQLQLIVRDNGRGPTDSGREGIGLANTKARLQALYGANHQFTFAKAEPKGCRVEILLPLRFKP